MLTANLVSPDLSPEESAVQVVRTLARLDLLSRTVFEQLEERLDLNVKRLGALEGRIAGARKKVVERCTCLQCSSRLLSFSLRSPS